VQPELSWLHEPSQEAVAEGLAAAGIAVSGPVGITSAGGNAPAWFRGTASVDNLVVKFAWSAEAARKLAHEARVMTFLADHGLRVPPVEAVSADPVLLVTRRVAGGPLWYPEVSAMSSDALGVLAEQVADFLATLHDPAIASGLFATGSLQSPEPQATTDAIRTRFPQYIRADQVSEVLRWCDWADDVLAAPADEVIVHGDFAGHNWLWEADRDRLAAVVDFEEAAMGDPAYDLRYFPSQDAALRLLFAVRPRYTERTQHDVPIERVFAWHLRTSFGDALWRSEAGIALPFDGHPSEWVDEFAVRATAAGLDP
jgi:aminoglycoside phosphotransferase (APT) family kinase protein